MQQAWRRRARTSITLLALVAAACSSTTGDERQVTSPADEEPSRSAAARGGLVSPLPGAVSSSPPRRDASGDGPRSQKAAPQRGKAPRSEIDLGRGVSAGTVKVGFSVSPADSTNAGLTSLGYEGGTVGDERAAIKAIIAYQNARGGLAGRKIVPVYRDFDPNQSYPAEYQKDCSTFTEDNTVFAVVSSMSIPGWETLANCLAKRKTLYLLNQLDVVDQPVFQRYAPYLYSPGQLRGDRWGVLVDRLAAAKFFGPSARVGIVRVDTSATKRVLDRALKPRLAKYGLGVSEEASYPLFYRTADLGGVAAQMQNIALRFKTAGITHVMVLGSSASGSFFFTTSAESLNFRPRYGFFSTDATQTLAENTPPAQLRRSLLVGWWPAIDVDWAQDPKDAPGQELCHKILRGAGVEIPSRLAFQEFSYYCDELFFLKATSDRAEALTPAGIRAAADRIGRGHKPGITFRSLFAPGRYDGVDGVRMGAFDEACGCFKYRGQVQPAP